MCCDEHTHTWWFFLLLLWFFGILWLYFLLLFMRAFFNRHYVCICVRVCLCVRVRAFLLFFYFIESWKSVFWLRVAPQQFTAWHGLAWLSDYPVHFSSVSTQDSSHSVCSHLIIYKSWMRFFLFWCFQSMWTFLSFYLALSLLLAIRIRHFFHTLSLHVCVCVSSSSSFFNVVFSKVVFFVYIFFDFTSIRRCVGVCCVCV